MSRFPAPTYNRIIDTDPQVIKVPMEKMEWGARPSAQPSGDAAPRAPEMAIKHVSSIGNK